MNNSTVSALKCSQYDPPRIKTLIQKHFENLGGVDKFVRPGDNVLLKPNFIAPKSRRHATQTDPQIIIATAQLLKDFGAKPFVADSPAWGTVYTCVGKLGLEEPLKKMDIPVRPLDRPVLCHIGDNRMRIHLSERALQADAIVNLPKFKAHQQLGATFAVKNIYGVVTGKKKAYWHFTRGGNEIKFCSMLIDIFKYLKPVLTIIDGIAAMDGRGPISGRPRELGWTIAGTDPIACERLCCKIVNIDPDFLPIIRTARQMKFGCHDENKIRVVGDNIDSNRCGDFEIPELIPIRFSLFHVMKSVVKQIVILTKAALKKTLNPS